jgi:hypothetical protein
MGKVICMMDKTRAEMIEVIVAYKYKEITAYDATEKLEAIVRLDQQ